MSVGAVGGSGAAVSAGAVGHAGSASGSSSEGSAGAGGIGDGGASVGEEGISTKELGEKGDSAVTFNVTQNQNNSMYANMSSQDSMELHNCVHQTPEGEGLDLQKLIEMMMAMKLLEAMSNSDSNSSGEGFSAIA